MPCINFCTRRTADNVSPWQVVEGQREQLALPLAFENFFGRFDGDRLLSDWLELDAAPRLCRFAAECWLAANRSTAMRR